MLERSLAQLVSLDDVARRDTPLSRLDARAKVLVTLAFLVTVASFDAHALVQPLPLFLLLAAGMALGEVPVKILLMRLLVASPFALLIGIWNPLFDRAPYFLTDAWVISSGWISFLSIVLRFVLALGAVLLLMATTGFDAICVALRRMGAPRALVTQLWLLFRYSFLLVQQAGNLLRAHALRAPGHPRPRLRIARSLLGELLLRSVGRAERVHAAMLCRGFSGELGRTTPRRFRLYDGLFVLGSSAFLLLVRAVDLPAWLGRSVL